MSAGIIGKRVKWNRGEGVVQACSYLNAHAWTMLILAEDGQLVVKSSRDVRVVAPRRGRPPKSDKGVE